MGTLIELTAADGHQLSAYRAEPAGSPRGGLVVAQEIFGVNGHIRSVCDGYAAEGYVAIAPALFDRAERGLDLGYTAADIARGRDLKARSTTEAALRDLDAARAAVAESGKVGVIGYCWGGYLIWMAAARVSGLACAVSYYGTGVTDAVAEMPRCPVMAHFGEFDKGIPVAGIHAFAAARPAAQVFIYPADHGFNCDQRSAFDAAAARLARERTLAFLRQNIG